MPMNKLGSWSVAVASKRMNAVMSIVWAVRSPCSRWLLVTCCRRIHHQLAPPINVTCCVQPLLPLVTWRSTSSWSLHLITNLQCVTDSFQLLLEAHLEGQSVW